MMTLLSLGAGVQSSTMALMAAAGEITPMPDCAIFADTGWEPAAVYRQLDWLMPQLPFPVHIVSAGNIRDGLVAGSKGHRWASISAFVEGGIPIRRQCTKEYKIVPIRRKVHELLGIVGRRSPKEPAAMQWIGISWDEASRMKPAYERWWANRWPLIELRMSRWDCLRWLERHGYPAPPKSSCIGCPFHDNALWRDMKINRPQEFADAVEIDLLMRPAGPGFKALSKKAYLHRSCQPLDQVNFDNAEDRGQLNLFINECEGMCGV